MVKTSKWKINGNPILPPTSLSFGVERQAKTADRSESGIYDDDRIQDGLEADFEFKVKSWDDLVYMMKLLSKDQYIDLTYKSIFTGKYITETWYCGNRTVKILRDIDDNYFSYFSLSAHLVSKNGASETL
jgi:hypothetical protein